MARKGIRHPAVMTKARDTDSQAKSLLWRILPLAGCVAAWWFISYLNHRRVVPSPPETAAALARLLAMPDTWLDIARTILRGGAGLAAGSILAIAAGILCGQRRRLYDAASPVVTVAQSCPPIVWISILLVWLSIGGLLPMTVAFLSVFPVFFFNVANAVHSLDAKYFELAKVYRIPRLKTLANITLPGISKALAAGFSYALGITWKVTATAEFFGSQDGIGSRIYQSYRQLDLPELFAWTILLATMGVTVEMLLARRFRGK